VAVLKKRAPKSGRVYIGCSGWAYPSWKPDFYPASTPAKKLLGYYATQLNSVEVNYTFRTLPSEDTVQAWLASTGDGFRFSFKAPQGITHLSRLKNCAEPLEEFLSAIAPVKDANRLGAILFQLPPNMKADPDLLQAFLRDTVAAGPGIKMRMAFEFRHESWFDEGIYAVLRKYSAALCVAESDELITPDIQTAPFSCYRLRKATYTGSALKAIRRKLEARAKTGDVFAYFKHEEKPAGALWARTVLEGIA
jgi:uncharacterized protein YecE (DUF72 family)